MLYPDLKTAVGPLVALLQGDEEDRTKANAAGALGNLVRNSADLVDEIIRTGALQALLAMTSRCASNSSSGSSGSIALFSLGNMAAHYECARELKALGVEEVMDGLCVSKNVDATVLKYAARVKQKLKGHGGAVVQQTPMK